MELQTVYQRRRAGGEGGLMLDFGFTLQINSIPGPGSKIPWFLPKDKTVIKASCSLVKHFSFLDRKMEKISSAEAFLAPGVSGKKKWQEYLLACVCEFDFEKVIKKDSLCTNAMVIFSIFVKLNVVRHYVDCG